MLRVADSCLAGKFQVTSICQDALEWRPNQVYDGALCTFWISHVPNELLDQFLKVLRLALSPGAIVFVADHRGGGLDRHPEELSQGASSATEPVIRKIDDKRYEIVKEIRTPTSISRPLKKS
jgi:hypothetical protein